MRERGVHGVQERQYAQRFLSFPNSPKTLSRAILDASHADDRQRIHWKRVWQGGSIIF